MQSPIKATLMKCKRIDCNGVLFLESNGLKSYYHCYLCNNKFPATGINLNNQ